MGKGAEPFRKGLVSLQEAVTQARITLYEMMDYLQKEKIRPHIEIPEEIEKRIKRSLKLVKEKSKD